MKVLKNKRKGNTVTLEIEASVETIDEAFEGAFNKLVKTSKIPGFRKGKVPRSIFEKHYGRSSIVQEGLPDAVNKAYFKAIQELKLDVVDYPKNVSIGEYKENKPVTFTCEVDVKPTIKLGKYKGLKITKDPDKVGSDKIDEQIKQLQENAANYNEVDRPSQVEDIVRLDIESTIDNAPLDLWTRKNMGVKIGLKNFGEEFDTEITNLKKDEEKSFTVTYADDYTEATVAGKKVEFKIKLIETREKELPTLNDEFAKKVSKFQTFSEFKDDLEVTLSKDIKEKSENKLRTDLINLIIEDSKMEIPEGMITHEIEADMRYYEQSMAKSGGTLASYLKMINQSEEDFKKQLRDGVIRKIQSELVIEEIALKEKNEVTDEDLKAEVRKMVPTLKEEKEVEDHLNKINKDGLKQMVEQRKVVDFIVSSAKIKESK
jgi:trigger factor